MEQTEDLFTLTRTCDRLSPEYLKLCKNLVKAVDYLGSAFITKVALIELEKLVDGIEMLTADRLYQMISYNFRKINDALNTVKQTQKRFDLKLYNWLLIFGKVLERLRVTQNKALYVTFGMIKAYEVQDHTTPFKPGDKSRSDTDQKSRWEPFRETPSYQIRYDVLKEAVAAQKEESDAIVQKENKPAGMAPANAESGEPEVSSGTDEPVIEGNFTHVSEETGPSETIAEPVESEETVEVSGTESSAENKTSYREIMKRAAERSAQEGRDIINFTLDEIQILLADEKFRREEPEVVPQFQEIIRYAQLTGALPCSGMPDSS